MKLRFWSKNPITREGVEKRLNELEESLKTRFIQAPDYMSSAELLKAASEFARSTENIPRIVIRIGPLLLVKGMKDGEPLLVIETVSTELKNQLNQHPTLLKNPDALLHLLETLSDPRQLEP